MYRIGVDVMSGDRLPAELIPGCVEAAKKNEAVVVIVGDEALIKENLSKYSYPKERIEIIPSTEIITMDDPASRAFRMKPNSSLVVGCNSLVDNKIDAFITPGNTGASLAAALFLVKRIEGVKRPALATSIPTVKGYCIMLDAGANMDCISQYIVQFAIMGSSFYSKSTGVARPTVGLLNVGEEEGKGNELALQTFAELKKAPINFIGNVEPSDIFTHKADIIVCDGFVGNVALKTIEATAKRLVTILKQGINNGGILSKIGALLMKSAFTELKEQLNADRYGAVPLLGIQKPFYIGHGSSNALAIQSAIEVALRNAINHSSEEIENEIKKWG